MHFWLYAADTLLLRKKRPNMTVKSLSDLDKIHIANIYLAKEHTQTEIANLFNTSQRTVRRVLQELGIESSKKIAANRNKAYLNIIHKYGVNPVELEKALIAYVTPVNHAQTVLSQHNALQIAQMVLKRFLGKKPVSHIKTLTHTSTQTNVHTHQ